jgi:transcription termination factor NusB
MSDLKCFYCNSIVADYHREECKYNGIVGADIIGIEAQLAAANEQLEWSATMSNSANAQIKAMFEELSAANERCKLLDEKAGDWQARYKLKSAVVEGVLEGIAEAKKQTAQEIIEIVRNRYLKGMDTVEQHHLKLDIVDIIKERYKL